MHTLEQLRSGALAGTRRLNLSCGLRTVPPEVFDLVDTLEVLNLSSNQLRDLPHDMKRLHRLKVVFCSDNAFTHLPEVLGECVALQMVGFKANRIDHVPGVALPPALRWLTLTDNAITAIPPELGERPALQKLLLAGNQLRALPPSLVQAQRLELIRLAANQLSTLPLWLTELPRLSWLALSGNPLDWMDEQVDETRSGPTLPRVSWAQLQVDELLGEGASGWIYRAHRQGSSQSLALKLFKGEVTSDGLPQHELAACLAAGQHPALCTPSAELTDHPHGARGLLLPLIPPSHSNLAAPPSLDSCTRDVYSTGLHIPASALLRLAQCMAEALAHLHSHGVLHGDLYAHNILWNPDNGDALLSDFGAATLLPGQQPVLSRALQALDVRAFGCLLEELLAHAMPDVMPDSVHAKALEGIAAMAQSCLHTTPAERPAMAELAQQLKHS